MKGIIIDGVAAAGKTTVLQLLQAKLVSDNPGSTKLFISEHYTQRMLEHKLHSDTLNTDEVIRHIATLCETLYPFQIMLNNSKFAQNPSGAEVFVTIERFILTYLATQPNQFDDSQIEELRKIFKRLSNHSIRQYILVLSPQKIKENVSKTLIHRNEKWAEFIESKGGLEKAVEDYEAWQNELIRFSKVFSRDISTEYIQVDEKSYDEIAEYIYAKEFRS